MTDTLPTPPADNPVSPTDRFALTLFFAIALHAMIILGVTFGWHIKPEKQQELPTLDIVIATRKTETPEKAEYLAQTSQDGSGNTTEKVRPEIAVPEQAPAVQPQQPVTAPTEVVTTTRAQQKIHQQEQENPQTRAPDISARQLVERSLEMVSLNKQLATDMQAYAERPRQVFVSARTQEFKFANYMAEWVSKVERVGNLNYPDEARRAGISGKLMMDVALNPDGTVQEIRILRPSGIPALDDAATRIVNLAAPFAPFPPEIRKEADILHITRTWEFSTNSMTGH